MPAIGRRTRAAGREAPPDRGRSSLRCAVAVRQCLAVAGFLYVQLSTFTLVQWLRGRFGQPSSYDHKSTWRLTVASPHTVEADASSFPEQGQTAHLPDLLQPYPSHAAVEIELSSRRGMQLPRTGEQRGHMPGNWQANSSRADVNQMEASSRGDASMASLGAADELDDSTDDPLKHSTGISSDVGTAKLKPTRLSSWIDSDSYGKFMGITTFFNPGRHANKVDNFRKFRASVAAQGLQMLCVELVFGEEADFQLVAAENIASREAVVDDDRQPLIAGRSGPSTPIGSQPQAPDCDILIQRRTPAGNTLWQKERLLNIALENLPHTVTKVMWLDSDLIFLNDDWVIETSEMLDRFPVVQPFGWMTYLSAGDDGSDMAETLATLPLGQGVGAVYHSAGLGLQSFPDMCFRSNFLLGHPGFAWAARREVMVNGFYDRSVIGGGDRIMLNGFTGHYVGVSRKMPQAMADDVRSFGRKLTSLAGPTNVSYTPGIVLHIWHGNRADRDYTHRYQILLLNGYDPVHDVRVNQDGVLEWSTQKPKLHRQVNEYFNNRKEGPKPNHTAHDEEDDAWTAQRKSLSRPIRSLLGYHCNRPDYRASCKVAFKLWGDTLRTTQLQLLNKKVREQEVQAQAAMAASRAAAQKRTHGKRKAMRERKMRQHD